ncbi:UvrD-helicase domain-containing protein [Achromobacter xylosoxidans]|uniref:UvrD-helicase domain-containing protein n=2 Tax=Achromobacter TaxID=222 RepID=UPI0023B12230|nr:UvrD-helicase domain-containing protein [Achromobacter xylosoxidans]
MLIWLELSAAALALAAIGAGGAYLWKGRARKAPKRVEKRTAPRAQPLAGSLGGERGGRAPKPIVAPVVPPPPPPPPPSLLAAERQREIRAELSHRLEQAGRALPSDEQWKMILTPSTCVRVAAGAGSGKSTTLALRVIVLRYYLGAAWDEITVVTFTNKSRDDFIKKLLSNAQLFEPTISKRLIKARVRTFHSLAFRQARAAGLNVNTADRIPKKSPAKDPHTLDDAGEPGAPTEDDDEDSPDTPFAQIAKLDELPVLPEILREVGGKLLGADPAFKQAVIGLERAFLFAQPRAGEAEKRVPRVKLNQARDEARTQEIYELWCEKYRSELEASGIAFKVEPFYLGSNPAYARANPAAGPWYSNATVPSLAAPGQPAPRVILGIPREVAELEPPRRFSTGGDTMIMAVTSAFKVGYLQDIPATMPIIWISEPSQLAHLAEQVRYSLGAFHGFPQFQVQLEGEFLPRWVLEAFWAEAQFIQCLGLDVAKACVKIAPALKGVDRLFVEGLARFWPAFMEEVHANGMTTTGEVFAQLGGAAGMARLPADALRNSRHLLIDEFQDISLNFVKWIRALRDRQLAADRSSNPKLPSSFMVVGDDYQSIYGWRGASPNFFIDFAKYFSPGFEPSQLVLLANYRSSSEIVQTAEMMLDRVAYKLSKPPAVAKGPAKDFGIPVSLTKVDDAADYRALAGLGADGMVMARTNTVLDKVKPRTPRCQYLTIHGAKGLEAEHAAILGDVSAPAPHPIRTQLYKLAGLGDYDQSQRDEARRLVYVAITRAMHTVNWAVANPRQGSLFEELDGLLQARPKAPIKSSASNPGQTLDQASASLAQARAHLERAGVNAGNGGH